MRKLVTMMVVVLLSGLGFAARAAESSGSVQTDLVNLSIQMPAKAAVGEEIPVVLTVKALQNVINVAVEDTVPQGAKLVRTEPQAQVKGNTIVWMVGELSAGAQKQLIAVYTTAAEGQVTSCATVSAEPQACAVTEVGKPELTITKNGPAEALLGETVNYQIAVRNIGSSAARNVVVVDTIPDGLSHASGQKTVTFEVGDLAPGQQQDLSIPLKADKRGRFCNQVAANSSNAASVRAEACTVVVERLLEVAKAGPARQFLQKNAEYTITINNPGDVALTDVVVTDTAPLATQVVSAEGGEVMGNVITWRLAKLDAGQKVERKVVLTTMTAGRHCNEVSVATAQGLTKSASACTNWEGYPALLLEVVDSEDALLPGQETVYTISVTNQGTAPDGNVVINVVFPEQLSVVKAAGEAGMTVNGQVVTAAPVATIAPKQVLVWKITTKAMKTGDARVKTALTSTLLKAPVNEDESTQVY